MDAVLWVLVLVALVLSAAWLGRDPSRSSTRAAAGPRRRRPADDGPLRAPRDRPEGPSNATLYGPFLSPSGTILAMPEPLAAGAPRPEPDERWTLAPGSAARPASTNEEEAASTTTERVRAGAPVSRGQSPSPRTPRS